MLQDSNTHKVNFLKPDEAFLFLSLGQQIVPLFEFIKLNLQIVSL